MDMTLYNNIINTLCQFKSDKSHIIHKKKRENMRASMRYERCAQNASGPLSDLDFFELGACAELP